MFCYNFEMFLFTFVCKLYYKKWKKIFCTIFGLSAPKLFSYAIIHLRYSY